MSWHDERDPECGFFWLFLFLVGVVSLGVLLIFSLFSPYPPPPQPIVHSEIETPVAWLTPTPTGTMGFRSIATPMADIILGCEDGLMFIGAMCDASPMHSYHGN